MCYPLAQSEFFTFAKSLQRRAGQREPQCAASSDPGPHAHDDVNLQRSEPHSFPPRPNTSNPPGLMAVFGAKKFIPSSGGDGSKVGALYRRHLAKHPFLLFGLPFMATIVAGSFWLTPATALRYEKHDRKITRLSQDEALGLDKDRRRIDLNEEYYVSYNLRLRVPIRVLTPRTEVISEGHRQLGTEAGGETEGRARRQTLGCY